ncbi:SKA3 protein, partial [Acrocephalus arundinaceus]|nr:SKA3 protein [Acrocephalus arundinaceus]
DYEDESPLALLHDLHCEIKTQKEDVNASLGKSCSEKKVIHEFMKASEILMQRNAADLENIRELFQKYGYKPHDEVNSESAMSVQNKSDEEKANDVPHLSASTEKPPLPKDPLQNPQLSDFGLSQYSFSRPWSVGKAQHTTRAHQQRSKNETPLKLLTPRALPKTPKCKLKMDDYECVTPKLEHFGISEHTMCMNEDYTMSLIHKTSQTIKNNADLSWASSVIFSSGTRMTTLHLLLLKNNVIWMDQAKYQKDTHVLENETGTCNSYIFVCVCTYIFLIIFCSPLIAADDWMASPMVFVVCTPKMAVSSKTNNTALSRSPETKELPLPSHIATPQCPDFQTRWLKEEAKVVNSNYVHFRMLCHKQILKWGKIESVTKNDAKDTPYKQERIPFASSSDEYLKHCGDPSPPKLEHYDELLSTPPPPEITKIPDNVLKMLSQYNPKIDSSKAKEMETKAGNTRRYEIDSTDYCNKENRYDYVLQIWL